MCIHTAIEVYTYVCVNDICVCICTPIEVYIHVSVWLTICIAAVKFMLSRNILNKNVAILFSNKVLITLRTDAQSGISRATAT